MDTKEKIIYESLNLFSTKGFDAISVRDIAKAVGIKASSLYNHFKNKQDIFNTIIEISSEHVRKFFAALKINADLNEAMLNKLECTYDEQFFMKTLDIFKFYLEDDYMVKFRKLLTIEQFNNSAVANLYNKIFIDNVLNFQSTVFKALINSNILVNKDPYILAIQFYSPVFLMLNKCETITDKELTYLRKHISEFRDTYTLKG